MNSLLLILHLTASHLYPDLKNNQTSADLALITEARALISEKFEIAEEVEEELDDATVALPKIEEETEEIAEIIPESDIFELNEEEFRVEDIGEEIEITIKDEEEKIIEEVEEKPEAIFMDKEEIVEKEEEVKEEEIAETKQEEVEVTEQEEITEEIVITEEDKIKSKIAEISPRKKYPLSYKTQILPPIISNRNYDPLNQHLFPISFKEEYLQLLFVAIDIGDLVLIERLSKMIDLNQEFYVNQLPPLTYAITKGDINVIKKMLYLGFNPNQKDEIGNAPIHLAIFYNRIDILTELIKAGADITTPNVAHKRPLAIAIEEKKYDLANLLVKVGAKEIKQHENIKDFLKSVN